MSETKYLMAEQCAGQLMALPTTVEESLNNRIKHLEDSLNRLKDIKNRLSSDILAMDIRDLRQAI